MIESTRRRFLATAGAGAAAVGIGTIVPAALSGSSHKAPQTALVPHAAEAPQTPQDASGGLVAWIADVHADTVTLMVGDRDVVVHDRDLVARLAANAF